MSRIKKDIERFMCGPTRTDSILTSTFMFPPEFIGFQGHFPTNKVLPGTCQIQCAISTVEREMGKCVFLKEIILAKYIAPVLPGDTVTCTVSGVPDTGREFICKARFTKGIEKVTDLKLSLSLGDAI